MALKRSPEFCLMLIYRYLLKADHFPCDTYRGHFWPRAIILANLLENVSKKAKIRNRYNSPGHHMGK